MSRAVCTSCGLCWERAGGPPVDPISCPGCPQRGICESRPTFLVGELTSIHELADGTRALVRPLLYSDRYELADAYLYLTEASRRSRFFAAPRELSGDTLEYLTNLDYLNHFAWAAFALDHPGDGGIAVARYVRDTHDQTMAEAAATVADAYQHRGLGTLILRMLAARARSHGITTFVSYVRWANEEALSGLREAGAVVTTDEPGIARVEIEIPGGEPATGVSTIHALLRSVARAGRAA